MAKDFLRHFNKPYETEFEMKTPDGNKASFSFCSESIFMPITYEVRDTDSFLTLEMTYPDYSENIYPRLWFPWGSNFCIWSGNQILWHFSEAMSEDPKDLEFHPIMRFDPVGEDYDF